MFESEFASGIKDCDIANENVILINMNVLYNENGRALYNSGVVLLFS